jgi:zinc transporter 2
LEGDLFVEIKPVQEEDKKPKPHSHDHAEHKRKKSSNINLDAATIHIIGDIINSVGVIFTAFLIYFYPSLWYLDPFCTYFFSALVLCTTIPVTSKCFSILTEACPENVNMTQLYNDIWALNKGEKDYIKDVHDLHVWSLSVNKLALTVHIRSLQPQITLK